MSHEAALAGFADMVPVLRFAKFQGVASLTLHFPSNFSGDGSTQVSFIGLKGETTLVSTRLQRWTITSQLRYFHSMPCFQLRPNAVEASSELGRALRAQEGSCSVCTGVEQIGPFTKAAFSCRGCPSAEQQEHCGDCGVRGSSQPQGSPVSGPIH